jgi:hypothetical protein
MKSQTAKARNILYTHFNDGLIHQRNDFITTTMKETGTTQEWAERHLKTFTKTQEIEWLGNGRFVVRGNPNQLTLGDV